LHFGFPFFRFPFFRFPFFRFPFFRFPSILDPPNSVVDASTVNALKARLDKFWSHQAVKFDFTAVLTGTGNRSEELKK